MDPKNPLGIPEIVDHVALYLKRKDVASCVSVSSSWRDMFLPHRWRVVSVSVIHHEDPPQYLGPDLDAIRKHRHLIHELSLVREFTTFSEDYYPNLRKLTINFDGLPRGSKQNVSLKLTEMFPLLAELTLVSVVVAPASWVALAAHSHIKTLRLWNIEVMAVDTTEFWRACGNLEVLDTNRLAIQQNGRIPADVEFRHLRKLHLGSAENIDIAVQMDLILRSSTLEDLEWNYDDYWTDRPQKLFNQPLQNNHWPLLSVLRIGYPLYDSDLASILKSAGNGRGGMTKLRLVGCRLETQAHKALELQFSNLVHLDLIWCFTLTSPATLDILCGCPKLECLMVRNVYADDMIEGGPWVCQQLRRLVVCFRFEESKQELHQLVFERLSTLVQLEHLELDIPIDDDEADAVLLLQLDWGMEKLASLRQLTSFSFETDIIDIHTPQLGMDEVVWMTDHWKKLKRITGPFNRDPEVEAQIKNVFASHGISTH